MQLRLGQVEQEELIMQVAQGLQVVLLPSQLFYLLLEDLVVVQDQEEV
jgi:hypothetical protein